MKTKMGRPRLSKKGIALVFAVRLPPDEAAAVNATIRASGQPRPDWLRSALLAAVCKK